MLEIPRKKIRRLTSTLLRGAGFFVLLTALYFLVGLNFDKTRAGSQIFGSGTKGHIAVWVTGSPAPTVTLSANPSSIVPPTASSNLTWTVSGAADSCTASGGWSGAKSVTGGSEPITGITATTDYALVCSNQGVASAPASARVTVGAAPVPGAPTITSTELACAVGSWSGFLAKWSSVHGATSYGYGLCRGASCVPSGATGMGSVTQYLFRDGEGVYNNDTYGLHIRVEAPVISDWSSTVYQKVNCPGAGFTVVPVIAKYGKPFLAKWDGQNISQWKGNIQYPAVIGSIFTPARNANWLFDAGPLGPPTPLGYYNGSGNIIVRAGVNPPATAGDVMVLALTATPINTTFPDFASWSATISLLPSDFSLAPPTNSCTASAAPVALSWGVSDGAAKYNVFRVIDANGDGIVQQSEVDAAGPDVDLNVASPLLPANVCSGTTCAWTDQSAQKNIHYLYFVRARNTNGVAYSDVSGEVLSLTDLSPKAITPGCRPTASLLPVAQTINFGDPVTLTWRSTNSSSCSIDHGVGTVCNSDASCDTGGTINPNLSTDTTYILTCNRR